VIIFIALSDCVLFVMAITLAMLAGIVNWIRAKLLAYVVDILLWMANRVVKGCLAAIGGVGAVVIFQNSRDLFSTFGLWAAIY
jgi:hypothetical protein